MTTLISFLGKGKDGRGYNTACYRFDDVPRTVPFFGMALADYLKPDRLILVGTAGSMWDVFFEHETITEDEDLLVLMEAVVNNAVNVKLLQNFSGRLSQKMEIPVECMLIDYARDAHGQVDLLARLAEKLSKNESIALDVTHSFRHLPMLALVAARFLTIVRKVVVKDIYYGALEMTENGETPVIRLKGLLDMLDWVDALASFDKDGDYGVFSPLLEADGMPKQQAQSLRNASFQERINYIEGARQKLTPAFNAISTHTGLLGRFFRQELENRVSWARHPERGQRELALAKIWLDRYDYLRSTISLLEGLITQEIRGDHNDLEQREETREKLKEINPSFKPLIRLRNALAHGQRSYDKEINLLLSDETLLRQKLEQYISILVK